MSDLPDIPLPDLPEQPEAEPKSASGRGASFYMALLAIVISLVGTCVSIFEARVLREQQMIMSEEKEASVWPYVSTGVQITQDEKGTVITLNLKNEGVGPALIGDLSHTVGDQQGDFRYVLPELKRRYPNLNLLPLLSSNSQQKVLGAGETFTVFRLLAWAEGGDAGNDPIAVSGDIETSYCYCSIYGDCWSDAGERLAPDAACGAKDYLR